MSELEKIVLEKISQILPKCDRIEFKAVIGDTSYSIEFFATINGERRQCYELVDDGLFKEKDLESIFEAIAGSIRQTNEYKKGEVNKISFTVDFSHI